MLKNHSSCSPAAAAATGPPQIVEGLHDHDVRTATDAGSRHLLRKEERVVVEEGAQSQNPARGASGMGMPARAVPVVEVPHTDRGEGGKQETLLPTETEDELTKKGRSYSLLLYEAGF